MLRGLSRAMPRVMSGGVPQFDRWVPASSGRLRSIGTLLCALALLAGCASRAPQRDGPDARPPPGLMQVPDAVPRVEPLRVGGPNKPYTVLGRRYVPMADDLPLREVGGASWYGRKFHGRPTSSGEPYDMYAMTAAHRTMPIPSYARVRNPANGREVIVRINDRGPFVDGRVIDLSYTAALRLGLLGGVAPVEVERLTHDAIRTGRWRPPAGSAMAASMGPGAAVAAAAAIPPVVRGSSGWWLQFGAFRLRDGAASLQAQLSGDLAGLMAGGAPPPLALFDDAGVFRVKAGPWRSRDEALRALSAVQLHGLRPVVVQRR
jgi:rare lipoprotein A